MQFMKNKQKMDWFDYDLLLTFLAENLEEFVTHCDGFWYSKQEAVRRHTAILFVLEDFADELL